MISESLSMPSAFESALPLVKPFALCSEPKLVNRFLPTHT